MAESRRRINVVDIVDGEPMRGFQVRIFALCALVALLDGYDAQAIAFVASTMANGWGMKVTAFGPIFGAGTLGLAIGALAIPPFADRWGRKRLIIASTLLFGIFSLATAWVSSFSGLFALRFLTGLGVGAAVPCMVPLISEYAPRRRQALVMSLVTSCWPLGAVIGGAVASKMIPAAGWESVFYLGGVLPILLALLLFAALPESIRFMASQDREPERVAWVLRKIAPGFSSLPGDSFFVPEPPVHGFSVRQLFTEGRGPVTILLWVPFFMNFLVLFFMFNWLPSVMEQAGLPIGRAIIATVLFNLGGVIGAIAMGRLIDRFGPYLVIGPAYALAALFVGSIGYLTASVPMIMAAVFLAGFCSVGAQASGNTLAAILYPTRIRATGVGWAYGIGRVGSIVGPVIGGILLSQGWGVDMLFLIAAIPLILATLALGALSRAAGKAPAAAS